jgi:hypothetical protein
MKYNIPPNKYIDAVPGTKKASILLGVFNNADKSTDPMNIKTATSSFEVEYFILPFKNILIVRIDVRRIVDADSKRNFGVK